MTSTTVIIGGLTASLLLIFLCISLNSERYYEVLESGKNNILLKPSSIEIKEIKPKLIENNLTKVNLPTESVPIIEVNNSTVLEKEKPIKELNGSLGLEESPQKVLIVAEAVVGDANGEEKKEQNNTLPTKKILTLPVKKELPSIEILQKRIFTLLQKKQITFKKNSGEIGKEGQEVLDEIGKLISKRTDAFLEVQGHTDAGGKRKVNQIISRMHANKVKKYLINRGFSAKNIDALGFGESTLLFPDEPYNHLNRRVEIYIKRK